MKPLPLRTATLYFFCIAVCVLISRQFVYAERCNQCDVEYPYLCNPTPCGARNWIDIDFINFFSDGYSVPSLVAASAPGTPRPQVGILGDPATSVLGSDRLGDDSLSGVRIGFGHWLDDCGNTAITGSLFALGNDSNSIYPSAADQIISRPFFNVDPAVNGLDSELVNFPGVVDGTISVSNDSDILSGSIGLRKKLCCCADTNCCSARRIDFGVGYRFFSLEDSLVMQERLRSTAAAGFLAPGTTFDVIDRFETRNRFNGVEFSLSGTWQRQRWTFGMTGKLALGNVNQATRIDGSTTISLPGVASTFQPHGILAGPTNIGSYERDRFGVLTEAQLEVGYWVSCRLRLKAGYNFVSLNSVVRPGSLIDLNVNGTLIDPNVADTGPDSPNFSWDDEALILHGFNIGAEYRF